MVTHFLCQAFPRGRVGRVNSFHVMDDMPYLLPASLVLRFLLGFVYAIVHNRESIFYYTIGEFSFIWVHMKMETVKNAVVSNVRLYCLILALLSYFYFHIVVCMFETTQLSFLVA